MYIDSSWIQFEVPRGLQENPFPNFTFRWCPKIRIASNCIWKVSQPLAWRMNQNGTLNCTTPLPQTSGRIPAVEENSAPATCTELISGSITGSSDILMHSYILKSATITPFQNHKETKLPFKHGNINWGLSKNRKKSKDSKSWTFPCLQSWLAAGVNQIAIGSHPIYSNSITSSGKASSQTIWQISSAVFSLTLFSPKEVTKCSAAISISFKVFFSKNWSKRPALKASSQHEQRFTGIRAKSDEAHLGSFISDHQTLYLLCKVKRWKVVACKHSMLQKSSTIIISKNQLTIQSVHNIPCPWVSWTSGGQKLA